MFQPVQDEEPAERTVFQFFIAVLEIDPFDVQAMFPADLYRFIQVFGAVNLAACLAHDCQIFAFAAADFKDFYILQLKFSDPFGKLFQTECVHFRRTSRRPDHVAEIRHGRIGQLDHAAAGTLPQFQVNTVIIGQCLRGRKILRRRGLVFQFQQNFGKKLPSADPAMRVFHGHSLLFQFKITSLLFQKIGFGTAQFPIYRILDSVSPKLEKHNRTAGICRDC